MVRQYRYINFQDRKRISARYLNNDRVADIAADLGVTPAAVYRELKRGETGELDRNQRRAYGWRQDRKQAERVFPKGYVLQIDLKKFYPPGLWREAQMQIDHKKLLQQYQNKVNNAQGHFFEDYIKAACAFYKDRGRAFQRVFF